VDGIFGRLTEAAVMDFQRQRRLTVDGIIDKTLWDRLFFHDKLPIVDVVDVFHENIYFQQQREIVESGGQPINFGGMSNALAQMAESLRGANGIALLRMTGHGAAGVQALSMGKGGWIEMRGKRPIVHYYPHKTTSLNSKNLALLPAKSLTAVFGPYGSMELHGCHVAQGSKGHHFIRELAHLLKVPVTAGVGSQKSALHFAGQTFTAFPHGGTLAAWCRGLPPFPPITVP